VPRLLVYAPGPIKVQQLPPQPVPQPAPTVGYPSLAAACEAVQGVLLQRLGVPIGRTDSTVFENEFGDGRRTGCELKATGSFKAVEVKAGKSLDGSVSDTLSALGWAPLTHYSADGPDGTAWAMRSRETVCVFSWTWDGGDDSDSTYVPSDDWDEVTHCTPVVAADTL